MCRCSGHLGSFGCLPVHLEARLKRRRLHSAFSLVDILPVAASRVDAYGAALIGTQGPARHLAVQAQLLRGDGEPGTAE